MANLKIQQMTAGSSGEDNKSKLESSASNPSGKFVVQTS